ncbi:MAG TPA: V-type ATP synthase subunit E family protein [Burkholderiales bacterium]|jgi:vacuolar-type H+-ATPase subunit E/Vma4|nr:V-type ATP synthase subunit E family protein [Burkholderiales bacterium]
MKTETQDIEMLARAILTEAREEAEQLQAEAKQKADAIRKRAQEQAEAERKAILERAQQDAERLRSQAVATVQLTTRSTQLGNREQLLDKVFDEANKQLAAITKRPDYDRIAAMLLREALTQLTVTEAEIMADEATQKALKKGALDEIAKELNGAFKLARALDEGTGVVVTAAGGKLKYDNTFETRLKRLRGSLRSAVHKVLMGEQA